MNKGDRKRGRPTKDPNGIKRVRKKLWVRPETWEILKTGQMVQKRTAGEIIDDLVKPVVDGKAFLPKEPSFDEFP